MTTAAEQYRALVNKLESIQEADDQENAQEYIACIVHHDRSGQATVQRTRPVSHSRAQEIIRHALAKSTFKHPPFMTIYPASLGRLDGSAIMAQFPDMSQEVNEAEDDEVSQVATTAQGTTTAGPGQQSTDILQQIEHAPTFKQAYAMAKKAGLKEFKWCQCKTYQVTDKPVKPPTPATKPITLPLHGQGTPQDLPNNPSGWRQAAVGQYLEDTND